MCFPLGDVDPLNLDGCAFRYPSRVAALAGHDQLVAAILDGRRPAGVGL